MSVSSLPELRAQARALPQSPGVYFWKGDDGAILYIGKAVNLRARVASYFANASHDRRIRELISRSSRIEYELTATELQALFRESALIKEQLPEYNRALRTRRKPYYLKFDSTQADPYMQAARELEDDGSLYFGPFRSAAVLRETMAFLHDVLPLRKCRASKPKCRPCIYYQMHTCAAPALGPLERRQHQEAIAQLFDLLDGREDRVVTWLTQKRDKLCESLSFEMAAEVHERLQILHVLMQRQVILEAAVHCRCVLIREQHLQTGRVRLLLVARGNVVSIKSQETDNPDAILQWISAHDTITALAPLQQSVVDSATVLERWLRTSTSRVRWITIPTGAGQEDVIERIQYVLGVTSDSPPKRRGERLPPRKNRAGRRRT